MIRITVYGNPSDSSVLNVHGQANGEDALKGDTATPSRRHFYMQKEHSNEEVKG
jgi:hypothetical protein